MNRTLMTLIFLSLSLICRAQGKLVIENDSLGRNDTVIVITPEHLNIINGIFEEVDWLRKETTLKDSLIKADSVLTSEQNVLIDFKQERILQIENLNSELKDKIKKQTKKNKWLTGIASFLGVGLITSLIWSK